MNHQIKRLRIFAGPNGSGKSTLYEYLIHIKAFHSYYHINPDIFTGKSEVLLNFENWPIDFSQNEILQFLKSSSLKP